MPTIKDLHCGVGEFLTASSEVENVMLAFVTTRRQRDRARDEVFVDFMGKTLGQKIDEFQASLQCLRVHQGTARNLG
jgi:hypothetical protein